MTYIIMKLNTAAESSPKVYKSNEQYADNFSPNIPKTSYYEYEIKRKRLETMPRSSNRRRPTDEEESSRQQPYQHEFIRMSKLKPMAGMEPYFETSEPIVETNPISTSDRLRSSKISRGSAKSRFSQASSSHHSQPARKPLKTQLKDCFRAVVAFTFSNVGVCVLFVGYTILGSFLFQAIEKDKNAFKKSFVDTRRNSSLEALWNATERFNTLNFEAWNRSVSEEVKRYQIFMVDSIGQGYTGNDNVESYDPWSFEGGFLYSLTVITTIGYGHIHPRTVSGKVATILYTVFGMPVFLLYMANVGDILARTLKWTYSRVCVCRRPAPPDPTIYQPNLVWRSAAAMLAPIHPEGFGAFDGAAEGEGEEISVGSRSWQSSGGESTSKSEDISSVNIPLTISLVILLALLYGGTELFQSFEDWDPLTSFYFCFISLTTIGFGDVVPGSSMSSDDRINFIYCSLYLMFGLALLSMCFNLMQEEVVHKVSTCVKSITAFFSRRLDTDT